MSDRDRRLDALILEFDALKRLLARIDGQIARVEAELRGIGQTEAFCPVPCRLGREVHP